MCGYCAENIGIESMFFYKRKPSCHPEGQFWLQEDGDLLNGITTILDNLNEKDSQRSDDEKLGLLNSSIMLCRLIERFMLDGINSDSCKNISGNAFMQRALFCESIQDSCRIETLNLIGSFLPYLKECYPLERQIDYNHIERASKIFPNIYFFYPLYQIETYFFNDRWNAFINKVDLLENCIALLTRYSTWWLDGGDLKSVESEEIKETLKGTGVLYDPIMSVSAENRLIFDLVFRSLYFSLNYIGQLGRHTEVLEKIILTSPAEVPFFDCQDLWIQRKAAEIIYRIKGIHFFIESIYNVRIFTIAYLVAKFDITGEERKLIADSIKSSRYYEDDGYALFISEPESFNESDFL